MGADAEVGRQKFGRLPAEPCRPNQAGVDAEREQERAEDVQRVVVPRVSRQRSDRGIAEESAERERDQGPEGGPAAQQRGGANDQKSRQKQWADDRLGQGGAVGRQQTPACLDVDLSNQIQIAPRRDDALALFCAQRPRQDVAVVGEREEEPRQRHDQRRQRLA